MLRRHPILISLLTLVLLAAALVGAFLATFDLNDYRRQLENELSSRLGVPVELGEAQLGFNGGLALDFTKISIGEKQDSRNVLHAERLYLRLELLPLLEGRFSFTAIALEAPRLTLTRETLREKPRRGMGPARILDVMRAEDLEISKGRLTLIDRSDPQHPVTLNLQDLDLQVSHLASGRPGRIQLKTTLEQDGMRSPLALEGHLALPSANDWGEIALDLALTLENFAPQKILARYGPSNLRSEGTARLRIALQGSPRSGLNIATEVVGQPLQLWPGDLYQQPIAVDSAKIQGSWTATDETPQIRFSELALNGLTAAGDLLLIARDGWHLQGEMHTAALSLLQITALLPGGPDSFFAGAKEHLARGELTLERIAFDGALQPFSPAWLQAGQGPVTALNAQVRGALWQAEKFPPLRDIGAEIRLGEAGLLVEKGTARLWESELSFSADILPAAQDTPRLQARISGKLSAARLAEFLPAEHQVGLTAEGPIPITATITGPPTNLQVGLQADLQKATLHYGSRLRKQAGASGQLQLTARLGDGSLTLDPAKLEVAGMAAALSGTVKLRPPHDFTLEVSGDRIRLQNLPRLMPAAGKMDPKGYATFSLEFSGRSGETVRRRGNLLLADAGWDMGRLLAPVSGAAARFILADDGVRIASFAGRLGGAPISARGELTNFADPRLTLEVEGKNIPADALIFPSPKGRLEKAQGGLVIARDLIRFEQIRTELPGGTRATVNGSVRDFKNPRVELDIHAEYGNIDEVIALFVRPEGAGEPRRAPEENPTVVHIEAFAEQGQLGNLSFEEAEGTIRYRRGILTIYPLRFYSGEGYFVGRVLRDGTGAKPHLMKISGHLENFDAARLYQQQLERRGLVTGTLRGDFYLEGSGIGRQFLQSSRGGFFLEVEEGVLRRFQVLSKVFSLLNISQLFALDMPDMSTEGMPFNRVTGSFSLKDGVLESEELLIDSNAMNLSIVGSLNLVEGRIDAVLGVKPLGTVDKIVTRIPIAGWILGGEEKALITAHFRIEGEIGEPRVTPIPITSVSDKVLGVFKRVLGLPGKVISDVGRAIETDDGSEAASDESPQQQRP